MLTLPVGLPFALSFQVAAAPPPPSLELLESLASVLLLPEEENGIPNGEIATTRNTQQF
jgi:hypothetical protein